MIAHDFICDSCKTCIQDTNTKVIHKCPICKKDMRWNLNFNSGQCGSYNHYSQSLAVNPSQIEEHKQKFPGVDVLPDGRIHFTSVKQQDNYLKKTGFVKRPQKIRQKPGVKRIYTSKH